MADSAPQARAEGGREEDPCRPLLLAMFSTLKQLYVHCETHGRVDLGAEVVDALSMCKQDFCVLVERLKADDPNDGADETPPALATASVSPLAQRIDPLPRDLVSDRGAAAAAASGAAFKAAAAAAAIAAAAPGSWGKEQSSPSPPSSPMAQLSSPESNSRMLEQLAELDMEQLEEASRYFQQAQPEQLLPRKAHELRYLREAAMEGREPAARRFLVRLHQMTRSASQGQGQTKATAPDGTAPEGILVPSAPLQASTPPPRTRR